jgi:hypothetical protein
VFYAECHKEALYVECRYDECHGATLAYSVLLSNLYRKKLYDMVTGAPTTAGSVSGSAPLAEPLRVRKLRKVGVIS